MNFSNISLVQNQILCILIFYNSAYFCVYVFFVLSVCTFYAFRHKYTFCIFLFYFISSVFDQLVFVTSLFFYYYFFNFLYC